MTRPAWLFLVFLCFGLLVVYLSVRDALRWELYKKGDVIEIFSHDEQKWFQAVVQKDIHNDALYVSMKGERQDAAEDAITQKGKLELLKPGVSRVDADRVETDVRHWIPAKKRLPAFDTPYGSRAQLHATPRGLHALVQPKE